MLKDWRTISENVPERAVSLMAQQLTGFGADIELFEGGGKVHSVSGVLSFRLDYRGTFAVRIECNEGHFSDAMLLGDIRQFVEEAVELVSRGGEAC